HGAQDGRGTAAEAHGLVERVVPARGRPERAAEALDPGPAGEDTDPERVLEVTPPAAADDLTRDLLAVEGIDPGRQSQLGQLHGDTALERAGRPGAGIEHLVPARAVVVAARRRADLCVDRGVLGLAAESLGRALDALAQ